MFPVTKYLLLHSRFSQLVIVSARIHVQSAFFLPELKYVLLLLIVMGYFTNSFLQANGHLSVVCGTTASTLAVLIETNISFSKDTVNIMPGSVGENKPDQY